MHAHDHEPEPIHALSVGIHLPHRLPSTPPAHALDSMPAQSAALATAILNDAPTGAPVKARAVPLVDAVLGDTLLAVAAVVPAPDLADAVAAGSPCQAFTANVSAATLGSLLVGVLSRTPLTTPYPHGLSKVLVKPASTVSLLDTAAPVPQTMLVSGMEMEGLDGSKAVEPTMKEDALCAPDPP